MIYHAECVRLEKIRKYALEERIGREAVIQIIDEAAGKTLRFDDYPKNSEYILRLREEIINAIATESDI